MATKHSLDGNEPSSNAGGRLPALKLKHIATLHDIVTERAQAGCRKLPTSCICAMDYVFAMQRADVRYLHKV